jgi:WD40 repeat protein
MENDAPVQEFIGHKSEVMSIATQQSDPYSVFASCGNDQSARLWDVRAGKCVKNFDEHNSEVNSVKFFPTGAAIATADNSGVAHLLDLKADQEVMHYSKPTILQSASSLDFSRSG